MRKNRRTWIGWMVLSIRERSDFLRGGRDLHIGPASIDKWRRERHGWSISSAADSVLKLGCE